jgi:hypothetical protein
MPDSDWESMSEVERETWERDYNEKKGDFSAPRSTRRTEKKEGNTETITTTDTYSYIEHKGRGVGYALTHKCIRCNGKHNDYLMMDISEGGQMRPDLVYTPLHVNEEQWGQGTGSLYTSVSLYGSLTRRIETITKRGGRIVRKDVRWEVRTIDHIENRDYVVLKPFSSIIDCKHSMNEDLLGMLTPFSEKMLVAALEQGFASQLPFSTYADTNRVLMIVEGVLSTLNLKNPFMEMVYEGSEPVLKLYDKSEEHAEQTVGTITLLRERDTLILKAWKPDPYFNMQKSSM